jgi:hypothetical protein
MHISSNTKNILLITLIFLLASCENVTFDSYFPSDQKPLNNIDSEYLGKYYTTDSFIGKKDEERYFNSKYFLKSRDAYDSIILFTADLYVSERLVRYTVDFVGYYKLNKVDTNRLKKEFKNKDVFVEGDYFIHTENFTDTLLDLNKKDKLFLYKNIFYLNHFKETDKKLGREKCWAICQFEKLSSDIFSINMTNAEDYAMLFDTTTVWQPILPVAHLSNNQFKKFVTKGGFHQKYKLFKY